MKLTFLLMLSVFLQVSFAGNAQSVTYSARSVSFAKVLVEIESQTGYHFLVTDQMLAGTHAVSVKFNHTPINDVLKACFKDQPLNYEIKDKTIIIFRKQLSEVIEAVNLKITGVVTDDGNQPLPGVTIKVKGTNITAATDVEGRYTINAPDNATLVFSFIGFATQELPVNGKGQLNVQMRALLQSLSEVVVIGYGQQRKADVTSAVATVKSEEFVTGPVTDAAELLKGKVAGLNITTPSGDPTAQSSIQLRGANSITGNTQLLYIVDGVPTDNLNNYPPEDIAEISVLKDGSAAAIYGVKGTNGVILVTTKHASGNNINSVDYSTNTSTSTLYKQQPELTAQDYRNQIAAGTRPAAYDLGSSTNWVKAIQQKFPVSTIHNLSFRGGNSTTNYLAAFTYRYLAGQFLKTYQRQLTGRVDINHSMLDGKLKFNLGLLQTNYGSAFFNYYDYEQALKMNPTAPVKYANGSYYQEPTNFEYQNPVSDINNTDRPNNSFVNKYNATITLLPLEGLRIQAIGSYQKRGYENRYFENFQNISTIRDNKYGYADIAEGQTIDRYLLLSAEYSKGFGDHHFSLFGGYEYQDTNNFSTDMNNHLFPTDAFGYNNIGQGAALTMGQARMSSGQSLTNLISYISRLTYNYKEKYLLMASMRIDGASQLYGATQPFGKFPAVSAGWRITKESFMQNQKIFDDLKLRAGYGISGNLPGSSFLGVGILGYGNYTLYNGNWIQTLNPTQNPNPNLKWEQKRETNLGVDFSMWKGVLTGSVDLYDRRVVNLLYPYTVPSPPNLVTTTVENVGTLDSKGIEAVVNITPIRKRDFQWTSTFTFSTNNNKLVSLSNANYKGVNYFTTGGTADPIQTFTNIVQVGHRIGELYGYKVVGVSSNGYWIYQEPNGQTVPYSQFNHAFSDKQVLGNGVPLYNASWNNSIRYKNWDFSVAMRGSFDFQVLNAFRMNYEPTSIQNYNRAKGSLNKVFGTAILNSLVPLEFNSYYVENGDFWKIDNINLGYTFRTVKTKFVHNARVFVSTLNTFIITRYKGIDPEAGLYSGLAPGMESRDTYPTTRTYTIGLTASF
jgi:TonB-linked SusC/RagA family outer membrane protein